MICEDCGSDEFEYIPIPPGVDTNAVCKECGYEFIIKGKGITSNQLTRAYYKNQERLKKKLFNEEYDNLDLSDIYLNIPRSKTGVRMVRQ